VGRPRDPKSCRAPRPVVIPRARMLAYQKYDQRIRDWRGRSRLVKDACLWAERGWYGLKGGGRKRRRRRDMVRDYTAEAQLLLAEKVEFEMKLSKLRCRGLALAPWHRYVPDAATVLQGPTTYTTSLIYSSLVQH
jgi:hypothetical protein